MIVDIVMPKMGESITEGTILEWHKKVGDVVALDEILLEIGTDKVDSEIPSSNAGVLVEILGDINQVMDVGVVIARIETDSDQAKSFKPKMEESVVVEKEELELIHGTGKGGRVTKLDIINYLKSKPALQDEGPFLSKEIKKEKPSFPGNESRVKMDNMRKLIADHMRASIDSSAHVYVMTEVDMTRIMNYVNKEGDSFYSKEGFSLTYTPFIIKACVKALASYPEMNASIDENDIIYHKNINIGLAVAVDKGLMVPVIDSCEELNFLGLCRKVRDLATRTRNKQLIPDELQGSTFSISNFGVFNVTMGTPIINQPNVGILGVGAVKKRPVVIETNEGDTIGIKNMMILSLGFDHRIIDGAGGSQFVEMIRENIEKINLENLF